MFKFSSRKGNRHTDAPRAEKTARPANRARANVSEGKARFSWAEKVDWGRVRIRLVVIIFCLLWTGLWGRAWYLQMIEGKFGTECRKHIEFMLEHRLPRKYAEAIG